MNYIETIYLKFPKLDDLPEGTRRRGRQSILRRKEIGPEIMRAFIMEFIDHRIKLMNDLSPIILEIGSFDVNKIRKEIYEKFNLEFGLSHHEMYGIVRQVVKAHKVKSDKRRITKAIIFTPGTPILMPRPNNCIIYKDKKGINRLAIYIPKLGRLPVSLDQKIIKELPYLSNVMMMRKEGNVYLSLTFFDPTEEGVLKYRRRYSANYKEESGLTEEEVANEKAKKEEVQKKHIQDIEAERKIKEETLPSLTMKILDKYDAKDALREKEEEESNPKEGEIWRITSTGELVTIFDDRIDDYPSKVWIKGNADPSANSYWILLSKIERV